MDQWYATDRGQMLRGVAEDLDPTVRADLIFTSPPWRDDDGWYLGMFQMLASRLTAQGSMVVVLGNEWNPPWQTGRTLKALDLIRSSCGLGLAQTFVAVYDESLMSPSVRDDMEPFLGTTRVADMHTHAWWLCGAMPKVRNALRANSVIDAAEGPEDWHYDDYCRTQDVERHPAAMPSRLPEFFVKLLTDPGDLVLDPFAGSNATGAAAELWGRRWLSIEPNERYVAGGRGRFRKVSEHV
jgi:hypothetical protein